MDMTGSMGWLTDLLPALQMGSPKTLDNLTLVPIFGPPAGPDLATLDQALADGVVDITEVDEAGHVPTLRVHNRGTVALLLFDGEELVGAKQNRILNTSILVAAGATVHIPVSCVEQGRWAWRSHRFSTQGRVMKQAMRSAKAARLHSVLETLPGCYDADQHSVWREVAEYAERRGTQSSTGAMADVFESDRPAIESFVEALPPEPGQTGVAAFVNGTLVGVDLLGRAEAFASLYPKLLRGLAAEAIDSGGQPAKADPETVTRLLGTLPTSRSFESRPPGSGRDVRLRGDDVYAAGLVDDTGLVHLAVFREAA